MECLQNPRILASYRPFALRKQLDSNGVMMDLDTKYQYGHTMEYLWMQSPLRLAAHLPLNYFAAGVSVRIATPNLRNASNSSFGLSLDCSL